VRPLHNDSQMPTPRLHAIKLSVMNNRFISFSVADTVPFRHSIEPNEVVLVEAPLFFTVSQLPSTR
jgi:hypothetical protein